MYQAQVQNVDGVWVPLCEPTPSYNQAAAVAKADIEARRWGSPVRVVCVDSVAGE